MRKIIFLLGLTFFTNLRPIKEENAKWVGLGVGAGVGLISSTVVYSNSVNDYYGRKRAGEPTFQTLLSTAIVGGGLGFLAGIIAYNAVFESTPIAKFDRANKIINKILLEDIVVKKFSTIDLFIRYCLGRFSSNWPLIDARKKLDNIRIDLLQARSLLSSISLDISRDYAHSYIIKDFKELNEVIEELLVRITDRMSVLISHPLYQDQIKYYEKYLKEERKRREKNQEYWQRMRERERDRELLQNLTNQRPANVGVNFNMGGR